MQSVSSGARIHDDTLKPELIGCRECVLLILVRRKLADRTDVAR